VILLPLSTSVTVVAAMLGVAASLGKLWSPSTAVAAMRSVGLPSSTAVVRLGSLAECCIAACALVVPSWIPRLLLALSYGALAMFVAAAIRAGVQTDCGCFGAGGGQTGRRHLALNTALCVGVALNLAMNGGAVIPSLRPTSASGIAALLVGAVSAILATTYVARERAS